MHKLRLIRKWYALYFAAVLLAAANQWYQQDNTGQQQAMKAVPASYSLYREWDSVKMLHDTSSEYLSRGLETGKARLESTLRGVKNIIIRQDSIILLTLEIHSILEDTRTITCFYVGPFDADMFQVGNRLITYGYLSQVDGNTLMKADFVERYTVFSELSRIGLSGYQILLLLLGTSIVLITISIKRIDS